MYYDQREKLLSNNTVMFSKHGTRPQTANIRAAVFFNGECDLPDNFFKENTCYAEFDFFCADGGADIAARFNIIPLLILGDMDSISTGNRRRFEKTSKFIVFDAEKDKSDGEQLLEYLQGERYQEIHIFSATGGRIDQTLFNIQLLCKFEQATIITSHEEISLVTPGSTIENRQGCRASLIPASPVVKRVQTSGFKYEIRNLDVKFASTLTLSNVIISDAAEVNYSEGRLLLVVSRDKSFIKPSKSQKLKLIKGKKR